MANQYGDPYISTNRYSRGELKWPTRGTKTLDAAMGFYNMFGPAPPGAAARRLPGGESTYVPETSAEEAQRKMEEVESLLNPVRPSISSNPVREQQIHFAREIARRNDAAKNTVAGVFVPPEKRAALAALMNPSGQAAPYGLGLWDQDPYGPLASDLGATTFTSMPTPLADELTFDTMPPSLTDEQIEARAQMAEDLRARKEEEEAGAAQLAGELRARSVEEDPFGQFAPVVPTTMQEVETLIRRRKAATLSAKLKAEREVLERHEAEVAEVRQGIEEQYPDISSEVLERMLRDYRTGRLEYLVTGKDLKTATYERTPSESMIDGEPITDLVPKWPVSEEEQDEFQGTRDALARAIREGKNWNEMSPEEKRKHFSEDTEMEMANLDAVGGFQQDELARLGRTIEELRDISGFVTRQRDKPNPMLGGGPMPFYYQGADRFPTGEPIVVHHEGQSPGERLARSKTAAAIADEHMHGRVDPVTGERLLHPEGRPKFMSFRYRPGEIIGDNPEGWSKLEADVRNIYGNNPRNIPEKLRNALGTRSQRLLTEAANDIYADMVTVDKQDPDDPSRTMSVSVRPHQAVSDLFESLRGEHPTRELEFDEEGRPVLDEEGRPVGIKITRGTGRLDEIRQGTLRGMVARRDAQANLDAARAARMLKPRGQKVTQRLSDERALQIMRARRGMMTPAENVEAQRGENALQLAEANRPERNQLQEFVTLMMAMNAGGGQMTPEQMENILNLLKELQGGGQAPGGPPRRFNLQLPYGGAPHETRSQPYFYGHPGGARP